MGGHGDWHRRRGWRGLSMAIASDRYQSDGDVKSLGHPIGAHKWTVVGVPMDCLFFRRMDLPKSGISFFFIMYSFEFVRCRGSLLSRQVHLLCASTPTVFT